VTSTVSGWQCPLSKDGGRRVRASGAPRSCAGIWPASKVRCRRSPGRVGRSPGRGQGSARCRLARRRRTALGAAACRASRGLLGSSPAPGQKEGLVLAPLPGRRLRIVAWGSSRNASGYGETYDRKIKKLKKARSYEYYMNYNCLSTPHQPLINLALQTN
jgi:hypothetical protein